MSDNEQKNETVDDVLAEMLERADAMQTHGTTHGVRLAIREFVSRIKTARKRELAKVEADALEVGGIVEAARTAEKSSAVGNADPKFDLCRDIEKVLKIGRDFQKQDPWRGAHHDTAKLLCDTIEYSRNRLNVPVGNASAMHESLESVRNWCLNRLGNASYQVTVEGLLSVVDAALSAPARNCDLFDNWYDAHQAWERLPKDELGYFVAANGVHECEQAWLFEPATGRKGEGDGR